MTTLVVEFAEYKSHEQKNRLTFYVGCQQIMGDSRPRHEELTNKPSHNMANNRFAEA